MNEGYVISVLSIATLMPFIRGLLTTQMLIIIGSSHLLNHRYHFHGNKQNTCCQSVQWVVRATGGCRIGLNILFYNFEVLIPPSIFTFSDSLLQEVMRISLCLFPPSRALCVTTHTAPWHWFVVNCTLRCKQDGGFCQLMVDFSSGSLLHHVETPRVLQQPI